MGSCLRATLSEPKRKRSSHCSRNIVLEKSSAIFLPTLAGQTCGNAVASGNAGSVGRVYVDVLPGPFLKGMRGAAVGWLGCCVIDGKSPVVEKRFLTALELPRVVGPN
jgi:hypothetical protein